MSKVFSGLFASFGLGFVALWLAVISGCIMNVYQVVTSIPETFASITPVWAVKVIGVFVPPLGGIMGWVTYFS